MARSAPCDIFIPQNGARSWSKIPPGSFFGIDAADADGTGTDTSSLGLVELRPVARDTEARPELDGDESGLAVSPDGAGSAPAPAATATATSDDDIATSEDDDGATLDLPARALRQVAAPPSATAPIIKAPTTSFIEPRPRPASG